MNTLVIDTCHKNLVIGCFEDENCVASKNEYAWKKQSEQFFIFLNECMKKAKWERHQIDQLVITKGPGSYTGERIAMTFAKVLCTQKSIRLYTISTYLAYAGNENCEVMLDARSNRAYCGICEGGQVISESVKTLDEIKEDKHNGMDVIGDVELIGEKKDVIDFAGNFMKVRNNWEEVDKIHLLTPHYLKSQEELIQ